MRTIVMVLRRGKDFTFNDVTLLASHIIGKWEGEKPKIICLWDGGHYDLGNIELIPLNNDYQGTWSRMMLYSPDMEQYRPFLYIDLDTVIINSLEKIFELVKDSSMFIPLEDFYQKGQLATGLVWVPAGSEKIKGIWRAWSKQKGLGNRMDYFLRKAVQPDTFWQNLTKSIIDFKPKGGELLKEVPKNADLICFHGKPRIHDANIPWVKDYVNKVYDKPVSNKTVTVIIPYNRDRGWLKDAISSVPEGVQLLVSKGDGNWPENFNKVLSQATGDYIKYLHEDDMLTPNCIKDSVDAFDEQDVDFIHGDAIEIFEGSPRRRIYRPEIKYPTMQGMMGKNPIHSATLMYKREIFEKIGSFNEILNTAEEYEFNLRCLKNGMKIGYCDKTLAYYRRHALQKVKTVKTIDKLKEKNMVKEMYK
jgi:cellulose synthase/poly-beta-1,6-N-acetylglucosamine synthase-like glycosyltransferase